ncbi:UNKNOWN [Stylonychia lemnae]|uniref:Uncharacterized protein n=1 Tax=Stylonychia lemnae TaxID=5949 RepID=A0A078ARX2_STYLE|nr:UNKNOWN [Stylonychia lemnae]|eukprot:CDW83942.1 UNKNOWN [Stylonychia lemnae]
MPKSKDAGIYTLFIKLTFKNGEVAKQLSLNFNVLQENNSNSDDNKQDYCIQLKECFIKIKQIDSQGLTWIVFSNGLLGYQQLNYTEVQKSLRLFWIDQSYDQDSETNLNKNQQANQDKLKVEFANNKLFRTAQMTLYFAQNYIVLKPLPILEANSSWNLHKYATISATWIYNEKNLDSCQRFVDYFSYTSTSTQYTFKLNDMPAIYN